MSKMNYLDDEHGLLWISHKSLFSALLKERLRTKYRERKTHEKLDWDKFIELRIQKSRHEALPDTLDERDLWKLEELRRKSPVVPLKELFSKLDDDEDAPKKVLISGRPGVGKTTLLEYMATTWATESLWPEIDYLFLVKLRKLLETAEWSLSDLLIGNLHLSDHEKSVAIEELCQHSERILCCLDGLDEMKQFQFSECTFPVESEVSLSDMISSIISCSLLPHAKVLLTTRPSDQTPPSKQFDRVVDIYGFTSNGIEQYVDTFCDQKKELKQYIWTTITSNPNIATLCHTPILCGFVCDTLKYNHEHPESSSDQDTKTMTQLFVNATYQLAKQLCPPLKYPKGNQSSKKVLGDLQEPFRKHGALAKDGMTMPLKLIFDDADLTKHGFTDEDKQTGFLSGSEKTDPHDREATTNTWSFTHLTLQEFFGAYGLLQPDSDILNLLSNKASVKQNEMVITFLLGLLGDKRNAHFLEYLGVGNASVTTEQLIEQLATKLEKDPKKLATFVFETQCEELVKYIPEVISVHQVYPVEMLSLAWILQQVTCRITYLG